MTAARTTAALIAVALAAASLTGCGGDETPAPQCTIIAEGRTSQVVPCDDLEIEDGADIHHVPSTVKRKAPGSSGSKSKSGSRSRSRIGHH